MKILKSAAMKMRFVGCVFPFAASRPFVLLAALLMASAASGAPISTLYATGGNAPSEIHAIDGTGYANVWAVAEKDGGIAANQYAIAVSNGTIRTSGDRLTGEGAEYLLNGTPTGNFSAAVEQYNILDGTSDGTYNYGVCYRNIGDNCPFADGALVYRFDADWSDPFFLFEAEENWSMGITFDPTNNSLWISDFNDGAGRPGAGAGRLINYNMDGDILTEFDIPALEGRRGLAMDYGDDTLWLSTNNSAGAGQSLTQLSRSTGAVLDTYLFTGLEFHQGMEANFGSAVVPIPGAVWLFGSALGLLGWSRRKAS
jgi:hypothetical protein